MLFFENMEPNKGFTIESANNLFNPLRPKTGKVQEPIINTMRHCFIGSKMTQLDDLGGEQNYFALNWTEFLELLCRVSMAVWE